MPEEVAPHGAEVVLGDVPREVRQRRRKLQRLEDRALSCARAPLLKPARREVVRITSPPRRLRPCPPRLLARSLRTCPLPQPHPRIRKEPPPADPAWALPEHPPMSRRRQRRWSFSRAEPGHFSSKNYAYSTVHPQLGSHELCGLHILDEWASHLRTDAANMLFHVVNERHRRRRSMIFTTNKPRRMEKSPSR
jgi:hypothetical protein